MKKRRIDVFALTRFSYLSLSLSLSVISIRNDLARKSWKNKTLVRSSNKSLIFPANLPPPFSRHGSTFLLSTRRKDTSSTLKSWQTGEERRSGTSVSTTCRIGRLPSVRTTGNPLSISFSLRFLPPLPNPSLSSLFTRCTEFFSFDLPYNWNTTKFFYFWLKIDMER